MGRDRVAPRPARPSSRSGWTTDRTGLRGHPAQPGSPETAADGGRGTRSGRRTTPIFNDIFWVHLAYVHRRRRDRTPAHPPAGGKRQYASVPWPASRPSTRGRRVLAGRDGGRRRPGRPPVISSGRATSSSSGTSSAPWCNPASIASRAPFARLISIGSATSFEVPRACGGRWRPSPRSTSTRSAGDSRHAPAGIRRGRGSTRFDDRWGWLVASVVPPISGEIDGRQRAWSTANPCGASPPKRANLASVPCVLPRRRKSAALSQLAAFLTSAAILASSALVSLVQRK